MVAEANICCRRTFLLQVKTAKQAEHSVGLAALEEKRTALIRRMTKWRMAQAIYMPGATAIQQQWAADKKNNKVPVEAAPLWLPSSMGSAERESGCVAALASKELRLRLAQAADSLFNLRQNLRIKSSVYGFKKKNIVGQRNSTRAHALLDRFVDKINRHAEQYRAAYRALLVLDPGGDWEDRFKQLLASHVVPPMGEVEDVVRAKGKRRKKAVERTEGRRELSWIWVVERGIGEKGDGEDEFADGAPISMPYEARANPPAI